MVKWFGYGGKSQYGANGELVEWVRFSGIFWIWKRSVMKIGVRKRINWCWLLIFWFLGFGSGKLILEFPEAVENLGAAVCDWPLAFGCGKLSITRTRKVLMGRSGWLPIASGDDGKASVRKAILMAWMNPLLAKEGPFADPGKRGGGVTHYPGANSQRPKATPAQLKKQSDTKSHQPSC